MAKVHHIKDNCPINRTMQFAKWKLKLKLGSLLCTHLINLCCAGEAKVPIGPYSIQKRDQSSTRSIESAGLPSERLAPSRQLTPDEARTSRVCTKIFNYEISVSMGKNTLKK